MTVLSRHWPRVLVHRFRKVAITGFGLAAMLLAGSPARAEPPRAAFLKGLTDNTLADITRQALPARIAAYKSLGVKWVRLELDWSLIQAGGPDKWDLRQQDMVIQALLAAGINVLGLLDYTPRWANDNAPTKFFPPLDNAAFARFATVMAAHYAPMGVHDWEIWNEENVASFWSPAADPARYADLLKQAYRAIHQVDPAAVVMLGGLAQPWDRDGDISALKYFEALYQAGAKDSFDVVADHPYFAPNFPKNTDGNNWQKMFNTEPSFRSIMAAHGDSAKQIWATEVGAPTAGQSPYGTVISEQAQATIVKLVYAFAAEPAYPWIGPVFWYNFTDFPVPKVPEPSAECCFGLVHADGSHKPAFDAYQAAPATRPEN